MKKIVFLLSLIILVVGAYAENFSLSGKYYPNLYSTVDVIKINSNSMIFKYEIKLPDVEFMYQKEYIDGLCFFLLSEKIPKEVKESYYYKHENWNSDDKILILAGNENDYEYLQGNEIKKTNRILLFATTAGFEDKYPFIYETFNFTEGLVREYTDCSSYLREKKQDYPIDNLGNFCVDSPWVEGVKGDGIGEGFTIKNQVVYPYLLIMNGYISYKKPYLYKQNNRIKKLKVTGKTTGKSKILDVLDTPHPQTIDISFLTEPENIRVEIADVYKGTKYEDTCLNFCVTYNHAVIPYENQIVE